MAKLIKLGLEKIELFITQEGDERASNRNEVLQYSSQSKVVVMQAPGHDDAVNLIKACKESNKKIVIDYDDYSFDLSPFNPRYSELGTEEVIKKDDAGNTIVSWRNMEHGFDQASNVKKYKAFLYCVENTDLITTTTNYLANKFKSSNKKIQVLPNSIDFDLYKPLPKPDRYNNQIRIGWFGGDSHFNDLKIFKNVLPKIISKYPKVVVTLAAPFVPFWKSIFKDVPESNMDWHGWTPLELYPFILAARQFDIGLCPLEDNDFNKCKSNLKWLEFSALKVPVIAQNMIPYSNSIEEWCTGLLASTEQEWFDKIEYLINTPNKRFELADNAYRKVYKNFNLDNTCRMWESTYAEV